MSPHHSSDCNNIYRAASRALSCKQLNDLSKPMISAVDNHCQVKCEILVLQFILHCMKNFI